MIIERDGLVNGKRMARISDRAKLYFAPLLVAANDLGRLELDWPKIRAQNFHHYQQPLTEQEFWNLIGEYQENYLLCVYRHDGQIWGQWDVPRRCLPKYQKAADTRSPAPPAALLERFREGHTAYKSAVYETSPIFPEVLEKFSLGIGSGMGDGKTLSSTATAVDGGVILSKAPNSTRPELEKPQGTFSEMDRAAERLFAHYCTLTGRTAQYTLTAERRKKCRARLVEQVKKHGGCLEAAEADGMKAINNLVGNEYLFTNGYVDWIANLFKSENEFEKRLNWRPPQKSGRTASDAPTLSASELVRQQQECAQ